MILSYIDQAGAIEAHLHGADSVVTVAMEKVVFHAPVYVGDLVSFYGELVRIGRTSITVKVVVEAAPPAAAGADAGHRGRDHLRQRGRGRRARSRFRRRASLPHSTGPGQPGPAGDLPRGRIEWGVTWSFRYLAVFIVGVVLTAVTG